ncbi:MAG: hypothetical protein C0391_07810 [Anaerolinea sp.]|nr:hypothetical protein [Anaerolinea sp.]
MEEKQYWEYRVENLGNAWKNPKSDEIAAVLNQWGLEGWDVISISHTPVGAVTAVAKRRLSDTGRRRHSLNNSFY